MRFESIKVRGLGPYKGEVSIDLRSIAGQLIAVTGENGAGKSTLLELLAGALFRDCPTRGSLASLATERGAYVEVRVANGRNWTIRQTVDGVSGKGETVILDDAGRPVVTSGKVSEGDAWVAEHLPLPAVLYSSSFAVQGSQGFAALSRGERKGVLLRVLQIERYEALAAGARERAGQHKTSIEMLRARLADLPMSNMSALRGAVTAALELVETRKVEAGGARQALERAKAAAADATRARELAEQRAAVSKRRNLAASQVDEIETKLRNNRGLLERGAEIRAAVTRTEELQRLLAAARERQAELRAKVEEGRRDHQAALDAQQREKQAVTEAELRVKRVRERLTDKDRVLHAVAEATSYGELVTDGTASMRDLEAEIVEVERLLLSGKDDRIRDLRTGLQAISGLDLQLTPPSTPHGIAHEVLRSDDTSAAKQGAAPTRAEGLRTDLKKRRVWLEGMRGKHSAAERLAARAGDIVLAEEDLERMNDALARARGRVQDATEALAPALDRFESAQRELLEVKLSPLTAEIAELAPLVGLSVRLSQAEARIEELTAQLDPAHAALVGAEAELAALPVVDEAGSVDLAGAERAVEQAERAEREAAGVAARAQKSVEDAEVTLARRKELADNIDELSSELSDWTRLGQDLGRDGLQALEIDAAVPELQEIANDLLHQAHGSRFTAEIRTDRLSADGKRAIEGLDLRVIDTEHGRDDLLETYSGGERVIVGEAIALALTTLACRRAGLERPTLVRDERGAALDPDNGRAYVAMLRRAVQLIGADRCLLVSHVPELQDLCDARIEIADGKVEVRA